MVYIRHRVDIVGDGAVTYGEKELSFPAEDVLREAGFTVSERCVSRPSCFDFAARRDENIVLIKISPDVDSFSPSDSQELKLISKCLSAVLLLISDKSREKPLEEDAVYSRYGIPAITPKTFENIMLRSTPPIVHAGPGGYCVEVDSNAVRRRRQELGLSAGEMAELIGTSRRSLYGYERGMAKASVTAAYNLIWTLGIPVVKPINVFEKPKNQRKCPLLKTAKNVIASNKLLKKILKLPSHRITAVKRAPFDFVVYIREEKTRVIGGVANAGERELDKRIDEILSISSIVKAQPVLITSEQESMYRDIPCMCADELASLRPGELLDSLR